MIYKVTDTLKGRASCNHIIKKNQPYYIIERGKNLYSTCYKCTVKEFSVIIPIEKTIKATDLKYFPTDNYNKMKLHGGAI